MWHSECYLPAVASDQAASGVAASGTLGMNWDLVVIFTFVTVLTALRLHYKRDAAPKGGGFGPGDQVALDRAMDVARRLEQRVESLERVLDEDAPGWRARVRA